MKNLMMKISRLAIVNLLAIVMFLCILPALLHAQERLSIFDQSNLDRNRVNVEIFADGNIRGVLGSSFDEEAENKTIQSGSIGLNLLTHRSQWTGSISIAGNQQKIISDIRNIILNPESGSSLQSGFISYMRSKIRGIPLFRGESPPDVNAYLSVSGSNWGNDDESENAVVLGLGALLLWDQVRYNFGDQETVNFIRMRMGFGYTERYIMGDILTNKDLLNEVSGSKSTSYRGFEGRFKIQYNYLVATLKGFWLWGGTGGTKGISNGQLAGGISISIPFIRFNGNRYSRSNNNGNDKPE